MLGGVFLRGVAFVLTPTSFPKPCNPVFKVFDVGGDDRGVRNP